MKKIGILGPFGTFSEIAALKYNPNSEIILFDTISDVFDAVEINAVNEGVVPIENLLNGHVIETLDNLLKSNIKIKKAIVIKIEHCIAVHPETKEITKIISHSQALAQCSKYIRENFPRVHIEKSESTAAPMKLISEKKLIGIAAIGSSLAAERYNLKILEKNINNNNLNKTMFVVISRDQLPKSERNRTSIAIIPNVDRPGLLRDILNAFAEENINLEMIQSRPDGNGNYIFYIDFEGHVDDENVKRAFKLIDKNLKSDLNKTIKVLGSYPYAHLLD